VNKDKNTLEYYQKKCEYLIGYYERILLDMTSNNADDNLIMKDNKLKRIKELEYELFSIKSSKSWRLARIMSRVYRKIIYILKRRGL
jgi:hypothetical protein